MSFMPSTLDSENWIINMFSARAVAEGGIVRRKVSAVERLIGRDRFLWEVRRRGYRVIENAGQFIIICNTEPLHLLD